MNDAALPDEVEVLVLGAGPVGLHAAVCLAARGVRVCIVDKYRRTALHSYALALHAESLRLLDESGVTTAVAPLGHRVERIAIHRGDEVDEIDLAALGPPFPHVLVLPQTLLEGALERRLEEHGVQVAWRHQLLSFDAGPSGVVALVARMPDDAGERPALETHHVRAAYLLAADGYDSLARRLLDLEQIVAGPAFAYGLLEFEAVLSTPETMHLALEPQATDVLWPLAANRGRFSLQLSAADEGADAALLERRIGARMPWFRDGLGATHWCTTVRFEPRLARRFGHGRVWLAGDAARFTSPVAAQSMNVGLREGWDLARRMSAILRDGRSPALLERYDRERLREWRILLGLEGRGRPASPAAVRAGATEARLVSCLPATGRDLELLLQQL
jgi:2-polyprenyl-6-methoxyphenol hydroxylase-like FAD-dependent oxidoreductase